jgi:hypothetical protein
MQYLIPFVVSNDVVDRYDVWLNTMDMQDIMFFEILAKKFSKINLVYQPDGIVNGNRSINAFYRQCTEEDTIYFKLDDDIVWMEPDTITKMVRFRIDHPEYFIVSPLVINNAICTYILQNAHKIKLDRYYPARANESILWGSGTFAAQLHDWFLTTQLPNDHYKSLHCGKHPIAINRFSINTILWFGHEMKKFEGIVDGDDEEWLSVIKPTELGVSNCINGDAIVAHFAFYIQRKLLDKRDILNRYGVYLHTEWERDERMSTIYRTVQAAMCEVKERKAEISSRPNIYPSVWTKQPKVKRLLAKIAQWKVPGPKWYTLWEVKRLCIRHINPQKYVR